MLLFLVSLSTLALSGGGTALSHATHKCFLSPVVPMQIATNASSDDFHRFIKVYLASLYLHINFWNGLNFFQQADISWLALAYAVDKNKILTYAFTDT